ncbi:putative disease resistance protein RGA1 [Dichanthelium oligosanthes]|uniref:Putative disease resistance protein RGA1 n=1 Tax=Dichanthelium oligosanthes TaxID=888268 RepID=A0A1E5UPS5_9POAL|nr:putative disease resistance protein RGA1 [Dichanthelium oligosanthes]
MGVKLGDLKNFLADADRRNITDLSVQTWVRELRDTMYDATNILDLCQLKAMEQGPRGDIGCLNPLLFCMQNPLHAHDIGKRIKNLNQRLDGIKERSESFNFINLRSYEDHGRSTVPSDSYNRETSGELNECGLVGEKIKEDARNLVEMLTKDEQTLCEYNKIMVFAIVGVGGIGKTTLAQKFFNDDAIQQEFTKKIWLSVNQDFNEVELLRRAISGAGGDHHATGDIKAMLERTLKEAVKGHKTLLVMDDVWDHHAWEGVLKTPLFNSLDQGSRVLVTTRHENVARGMKAVEPYHHVDRLEPEDAWSLLKKQVVRNENDEPKIDMLKDIGMGIIAKCDGLPLAVKVMGGLLCQKRTRRGDWENVLNDSVWSVSQMPKELNNAIYLSYQDLHPSLKACFLHYSLLPKSTVLFLHDIVGMWICEGFVHGNSRELEELGKEYYEELILRNLIEPNRSYVDQLACNMHDVVRSFAQYVSRDEALVTHNSEIGIIGATNPLKLLRLSLETEGSKPSELEWSSLKAYTSLRTLISVGHIKIKPGDSLAYFSSLRSIHIQSIEFDALAKSLCQLRHLRYLSIQYTNTSRLPENIGKMKFLQHINLTGCENLIKLPSSIVKLQQLRYLNLNGTSINNIPRGFGGLTNLRKLYGFPAHIDGDWCSLEELGPLSHLIRLHITGLENVHSVSFATKARIDEKMCLSYLLLSCTSRHRDDGRMVKEEECISEKEQQQIEDLFDELCPPTCLEFLQFRGYFGRQLPRWMRLPTVEPLGCLRLLMLEDLPCCTELPDGLCRLPCLEFLQILRAPAMKYIGPEFLHSPDNLGSVVKAEVLKSPDLERISNLPKLTNLFISLCPRMKILEGVPALQILKLQDYVMETLPRYLQEVNPRHLQLHCSLSLLTSIATGKSSPEWEKFSHIQQVKAYAHDYDNGIPRKFYVFYTRDPSNFQTNISPSAYDSDKEIDDD